MLVSGTMIARTAQQGWSELLTSVSPAGIVADLQCDPWDLRCIVSNPAQNRRLQRVILKGRSFEMRGVRAMTSAAYPRKTVHEQGEKAGDRWNPSFDRYAVSFAGGWHF